MSNVEKSLCKVELKATSIYFIRLPDAGWSDIERLWIMPARWLAGCCSEAGPTFCVSFSWNRGLCSARLPLGGDGGEAGDVQALLVDEESVVPR